MKTKCVVDSLTFSPLGSNPDEGNMVVLGELLKLEMCHVCTYPVVEPKLTAEWVRVTPIDGAMEGRE